MPNSRRYLPIFLRWVIAGLFLYSGGAKILDLLGTADAVRNYDLLRDPWITTVALLLPWVEIISGGLLLVGRWIPGALAVIAGSSLVFVVAIGSAWARGLDISCGCFGAADGAGGPIHYAWHTAGLLLLLATCVWLWWRLPKTEASANADAGTGGLSGS